MDINSVNVNNINNKNFSLNNINNIWFYIVCLMKVVVDSDEKKRLTNAQESDIKYGEFEENQKYWNEINEEIKNIVKKPTLSDEDVQRIQELKEQENNYSLASQTIQNAMKTIWTVSQSTVSNEEYFALQTGYSELNDMFINNFSLIRR